MLQLGFVSAILPDATLEEVFATAQRVGYECVEAMCWPKGKAERRYAGVTHVDAAKNDQASLEAIAALSQQYDVEISGLGYYPNVLSPNAEEAAAAVKHLKQLISMSADMGIGLVNSFAGRDPSQTIDGNWPRFLETWGPLIELAEKHEVKIAIENCPMFFSDDEWPGGKNLAISPSVWRRMFTDIPSSSFGLNYDPSHLIFMQMDEVAPLREFADRIFHVHAKDVRVDREKLNDVGILANPNEYHSPKLPGTGEVDWGHFFSTLTEVGYRGPVCVEVEDRAYEGSHDDCERALIQCHQFLRNFVPRPITPA